MTFGDPKSPNKLLGQYFGGYGWPYHNFPEWSKTLHVFQGDAESKKKLAFAEKGFLVEGRPPEKPVTPNPIAVGTIVESVDLASGILTLIQPMLQSSMSSAFKFTRPTHDYAAEAMIRLWYSWAKS
jgi:hypothetical protein